VGEWIDRNTQPQDWVGALEVGIIGIMRNSLCGFSGLIEPKVAQQIGIQKTMKKYYLGSKYL